MRKVPIYIRQCLREMPVFVPISINPGEALVIYFTLFEVLSFHLQCDMRTCVERENVPYRNHTRSAGQVLAAANFIACFRRSGNILKLNCIYDP